MPTVETLAMPRPGHTADEYEDASAVSPDSAFPFRAAVADGATESAFSGGWARALVAGYVAHGDLVEAAAAARTQFAPRPDPRWYVQAKAAEGAHAALLGLEIDGEAWQAEAVGDCCLFHVREGALNRSWPFDSADAFHHRPHLVSSRSEPEEVIRAAGAWAPGDAFVLASDALAAWLLDGALETFLQALDRRALVDAARAGSESSLPPLRNDDLTALIIHP